MGIIDWTKISIQYEDALKSFKTTVGVELIEAIMSIPDTVAFIEFIYEEAAQTALFALYQAHKTGNDDMAKQILDYIKLELLPDAVAMIRKWGVLNPATKTCFEQFFNSVAISLDTWTRILYAPPPENGVLMIWTVEDDVDIFIDEKYVGKASNCKPIILKLAPDRYNIRASKSGYKTKITHATVRPGDLTEIQIDLVKAD